MDHEGMESELFVTAHTHLDDYAFYGFYINTFPFYGLHLIITKRVNGVELP